MPVLLQLIIGFGFVQIPRSLTVVHVKRPIQGRVLLSAVRAQLFTTNIEILNRLIVLFRHYSGGLRLTIVGVGSLFIPHQVKVAIAMDQGHTWRLHQ